jgi:dihydrofolate synthase/folylpolyglutamate synthase
LAWLESHVNLEAMASGHYRTPTLDRIRELCSLLGDPQDAYPTIHITGTNGKGSVARMVSDLLSATGLSVGTYTSPDLEGIGERMCYGAVPIDSDALGGILDSLRILEPMMSDRPTRFELLTAAAFAWFADLAVDVAVVEVGMGGRWDATNVVRSKVAVITNVSLDHTEILGPTRLDIAKEKAGIIKPGSVVVVGEEDPEVRGVFEEAACAQGAESWVRGEKFDLLGNRLAVGGRLLDIEVPGGLYEDLFLPLHGAHQGSNAAVALAAVDAFLEGSLAPELVSEALATVTVPGRLEVMARQPLVILDGAHNIAGVECLAAALDEEFAATSGRIVVMGLLSGRDPEAILSALGPSSIGLLIACPAPSPRSLDPEEVVAAASGLGIAAQKAPSVAAAVESALERAGNSDTVVVTGSMYVVGAARTELVARRFRVVR